MSVRIGIHLAKICERVIRKANAPGQICRLAIATAVQKTTDPAENKRQHQPNSQDIKITTDGQLVIHQVEKDNADRGNDTTQ